MLYSFKNFEFDSESLVLRENGESIAIRNNEAKLLALLLEQSDKVFSKESILSLVWQEKIVSEQAVFQNISHLRSLFGNDAIKTFPKRGYQWQLATKTFTQESSPNKQAAEVEEEIASQATLAQNTSTLSTTDENQTNNNKNWLYAIAASMLVLVTLVFTFQQTPEPQSTSNQIEIAYIPLSHMQDEQNFSLVDNDFFDFTAINDLTTEQFYNTIELTYGELSSKHPLILTAQIRRHNQQSYVDFLIKGPFSDWQGQLVAESSSQVIAKLLKHLQQEVIYQLLNTGLSPELKQASLSIAHQKTPNDLVILGALINVYIEMNELEKAMVMANKLANQAESQANWQQLGNALLLQSKVLTRKELFELSSHKLNTAIRYFEQIADLKRQADAWFAQSWLDHLERDYPAIKVSLLRSADLALKAKDIPRELDALTYLSILAYKHKQKTDKYLYLQQAENKMKDYQLPTYHFAKVPFHYAIYAKNASDKEPHWKQVLEYTKLTPDHWVAQSSRKGLVRHFIKQDRLAEAKTIVEQSTTDNAENSYLKAILAQAYSKTEQFNHYAQRTFEQARLAGETRLSLDVALLLCSEPTTQVDFDFYSQYIANNATKYWRQDNKEKLLALNF